MGWPYQQKPLMGWPLDYDSGLVPDVGFWPMLTGSGNIVQDLSGNGNDGTLNGTTPSWTAGKFGPAVLLPGTDEYIVANDSDSLDVQKITISVWLYVTTGSKNNYIVAKSEDIRNQDSYRFSINTNDKVVWGPRDSLDAKGLTAETSTAAVSIGSWFHLAVTYDGSGNYGIYKDGIPFASDGAGTATGNIVQGTARLTIGARYDASETTYKLFLSGLLDNLLIYNRALSPSEIALLYYYPFWVFKDPAEVAFLGAYQAVGNAGIMTTNAGYWGPTF